MKIIPGTRRPCLITYLRFYLDKVLNVLKKTLNKVCVLKSLDKVLNVLKTLNKVLNVMKSIDKVLNVLKTLNKVLCVEIIR